MSASDDELRAHLVAILDHTRSALASFGVDPHPRALVLPMGSDACTHPTEKRTFALGGYWSCECGAQGRDEEPT